MKAILRKPFPVRPLIPCTRLHDQRDFVQQEQTLRLNPLVQVHTTGVPRPPPPPTPPQHSLSALPRGIAVSYQKVKVTVTYSSCWKCLY